ncbi:MAG: DUF4136 domain-containing protein [Sphingomonadales bacterium]
MQKIVNLKMVIAGALLATSTLTACETTPKVRSDFDSSYDFASYETFTWAFERVILVSGDYILGSVKRQVMIDQAKLAFEEKGYRFVDNASEADFVVSLSVGAQDKIDVDYVGGPGPWIGRTYTSRYTEGGLAIDIFDGGDKRAAWHGQSTKRLPQKELDNPGPSFKEAVSLVLANFPPQPTPLEAN